MNLPRTALLFLAVLLAGCDKEEAVKSYSAPKDPEKGPIAWTEPAGWKAVAADPKFQYAAFEADGGAKIAISFLSPDAPGARDLLQNVNRWRRQLELPNASAAEMATLVAAVDQPGATVQTVDFSNPAEKRIRASILPREDRIWFFKLSGPAAAVEAQKDKFDAFVRTAKIQAKPAAALVAGADDAGGGGVPAGHPPVAAAPEARAVPSAPGGAAATPTEAGGLKFDLPAGWSQVPNANSMRVLSLSTGGDAPASLIVTKLSANFGAMQMNIDRWRGEVGLAASSDPADAKETAIRVGTADGALVDFQGPGKEANKPLRSLVARRTVGDAVWFFKILGPSETVSKQRPGFEQFLASLRFSGEGK